MCSYPIFACVFSAIFLKERFGLANIVALLTAFGGIYLLSISNPGASFRTFGRYELITVGGAVLAGSALAAVRKLHDTDTSAVIYFAQCAVGMWLVLLPGIAGNINLDLPHAALLPAIGIITTVGQLLMTEGYKYLPVRTGSLICMPDPVLAFTAGIIIFASPVRAVPSGAALVVGACVLVLGKRDRPESPRPWPRRQRPEK